MSNGPEVVKNEVKNRFEARLDGEVVGMAYYRRHPSGKIFFTHTEVDDAYQGRGFGGALAKGALDLVRSQGDQVVPLCPFIASYIREHQDYADLVDQDMTSRFTAR